LAKALKTEAPASSETVAVAEFTTDDIALTTFAAAAAESCAELLLIAAAAEASAAASVILLAADKRELAMESRALVPAAIELAVALVSELMDVAIAEM
jgi:hypothetical protein